MWRKSQNLTSLIKVHGALAVIDSRRRSGLSDNVHGIIGPLFGSGGCVLAGEDISDAGAHCLDLGEKDL